MPIDITTVIEAAHLKGLRIGEAGHVVQLKEDQYSLPIGERYADIGKCRRQADLFRVFESARAAYLGGAEI